MIPDIADVEIALVIQRDGVRTIERCLRCAAAVTRESRLSRSGNGRDDSLLRIDAADDVVLHLDEKNVPGGIKANFVRLVEFRVGCRSAIARVSLLAGSRDDGDLPGGFIQTSDNVSGNFANVESAVRSF